MNKKLLVVLTGILVLAFAVPAFASLTGFSKVPDQIPAVDTGALCNPGICQQACGGDPAVCAQGGCDQAGCANAGTGCATGAACGAGGCGNVSAGCGGGGCGTGTCANLAPSANQ